MNSLNWRACSLFTVRTLCLRTTLLLLVLTAPLALSRLACAEPVTAPHTEFVVSQDAEHRVRYTSGHTICVEALRDGHWIVAYRCGDGRVNMPNEVWTGDAFVLEIDHERVDGGWEWASFANPDVAHHGVVELWHPGRRIRVRLHTELDGTPVLKRWLEITNESSSPVAITAVSPWGGRLSSAESWQLGYYRKDEHKMEGWFEWSALPRWQTTITSINGQGHDAPFFVLRNDTSGEYFIASLAWSANWRLYLFQDRSGKVTFELGPYAEAPLRIVAPGETVNSPALHLGHISGDLDDAVQAMHTHVRRSVIPTPPANAGLVQYRVPADQGYHVPFNEETARENVDMAAAIGAELFILDAYWWDVTCDWYPSKERFPNGLEPLIDYVRKKGMRFGLYTEAEGGRGNVRESAVAREHPEWIGMKGIVNVGIPEAASWVESEIERLVDRYKLDLFLLDFNPEVTGGGIHTVQHGMPENNYWRYYEGCNALYDRVLRRHPHLAMQQCAGGGARNDLGMMQVFHQTLVSDGLWIPREQQAFAGQALMLPPESLIVLHGATGYVSPGYPENFDTILRTTFTLGTPQIFSGIVAPSPAELTPDRRERFMRYGKIYKEFIRPILPVSRMYQHAPVTKSTGVSTNDWLAMEFDAPDRTKGWFTCIRMANGASDTFVFRARGLDPGMQYQVTFDSTGTKVKMPGKQLMVDGVPIRLETVAMSELLLFESA